MHTNRFLPPPVRLSQAIDEDFASSSGSACQITRRSFMKRTGGATVATLVAWNMASKAEAVSMIGSVSEGHSDWGERILICRMDPRDYDEHAFREAITGVASYEYDTADGEAWRNIPQIEFSDGMAPQNASGTVIDGWGQGVTYRLLHWLEFPAGKVVMRGHHVNAERLNSKLDSTIRSWAAVVEGRWLYKRAYSYYTRGPEGGRLIRDQPRAANWYVKDRYCYRILLLAVRELTGIVLPKSPDPEVVIEPAGEGLIPWIPFEFDITWNCPNLDLVGTQPQIIGWLQLGNYFGIRGTDSNRQRFVSTASVIPKSTLAKEVFTVGSSASVAWKIGYEGCEIGGNSGSSSSLAREFGTTVAPKVLQHQLDWRHLTITTMHDVTVDPSTAINMQNPANFLRQCFADLPENFIEQVEDNGSLKPNS